MKVATHAVICSLHCQPILEMNLADLPNSVVRFTPKNGWRHIKIAAAIGSISKL